MRTSRSARRQWLTRRIGPRRSRRRRIVTSAAVLIVLAIVAGVVALVQAPAPVRVSNQFIAATAEGSTPVQLDTALYRPASTPAPAILLAHGLGGTKASMDSQARDLARHGYVVLTYTARGFGASGGKIHLDSLDYEVLDGSRLLDWLQARPEVLRRNGAPVFGVAGASYGGALALMLGATDHRIGAVAADITWNSLVTALFPNNASSGLVGSAGGVFKKLWVGYLFSISMGSSGAGLGGLAGIGGSGAAGGSGAGGGGSGAGGGGSGAADGSGAAGGGSPTGSSGSQSAGCGRFADDICRFYQATGTGTGSASDVAAELTLLNRSSPASVLSQMKAPVLLTQGEQDSLFPLSEADANARQLTAAGAPLQVRWRSGGHDGGDAGDDVPGWQRQFFDARLRSSGGAADNGQFTLAQRDAGISATNGRTVNTSLRAVSGYPATDGTSAAATAITLHGSTQSVAAPPGGSPAAVTAVPALGAVLNAAAGAGLAATSALSQLPGQTATFVSDPLTAPLLITGSSSVRLTVSGTANSTATLFASLRDLGPDGTSQLPANLVAPLAIALGESGSTTATVQLPGIVTSVPAGHRLQLVVSTTDLGYQMPAAPAIYRIGLGSGAATVDVPSLATRTIRTGTVLWWPVTAAVVVALCVLFGLWRKGILRRRRRGADFDPELAEVPVAVRDLVKEYADGYRAVDGVSFTVEHGQIVGLLGPNGAGKTTTLRVLMGLILPTSGSVRVFGHEVRPGVAVLERLGAFVEGPGLLPHLSGAENLRLYWAATGRPIEQAQLDTVLEIAGLGESLNRRVKTYSHGMQQRLAIAQAMLGLPEVLVLDEPTNGLDPPQIAEMREVLRSYADTGRTVIVSSHLLAEVEQTCTHVVVMHHGKLVASGSVADVAGAGSTQLAVPDPERAEAVLAAAGIRAEPVPARRALEDVFLDLIGDRRD